MRHLTFIIFFTIVMVLYALLNYYIIRRGLPVFGSHQVLKNTWIWGIILLAASFVAGRFLERVAINQLSASLIWIGSFWLGIMAYLVLQLVVIDIVRGLDSLFHFLPESIFINPLKTIRITALCLGIITVTVVIAGYINARNPKVTRLTIHIDKPSGDLKNLTIAAFSDLHLGTITGQKYLGRIIGIIDELKPDIILIPGDIIDEDIAPVIKNNSGELLKKLHAPLGVYAVTGNHEYIGGVDKAKAYLKEHQINVLNDTTILIANSFYLAGREDISMKQFKGKARKPLSDILAHTDRTLPIILLDHQPVTLGESEAEGVDLQLSGHTHNGQLWPFNVITNMIFRKGAGYLKTESTHFYISHGIGTWGPPIRTSSRPEIVFIQVAF